MSLNVRQAGAFFKKNPLFLVSVSFIVIFSAWLYARMGLRSEAQTELEKYSELVNYRKNNIQNAAQLQQQFDFLRHVVDSISANRSADSGNLALNLQYFYRLEGITGIKYVDLKQGSKPKAINTKYIPLNFFLNLEGDFSQVLKYLRCLERGALICRINSAGIDGSGDSLSVNLNVDLLSISKTP